MAFNFKTLPKTDTKGCILVEDKKYYLKNPPIERAEKTLTVAACEVEVVAAKFYQYLLGTEVSPDCHRVFLNGKLHIVASEYLPCKQIDSLKIATDALPDYLQQVVAILAAAFLLRESDLNLDSIRLIQDEETNKIKVKKIDHDHSLTPGIHAFPIDASALSLLSIEADGETLLNWCGFHDCDFGRQLKKQYETFAEKNSTD